ncbi:hypothetical protein [Peribacillus frigoritolerans]
MKNKVLLIWAYRILMIISRWTVVGVVIGIGGGLIMGISSRLLASN